MTQHMVCVGECSIGTWEYVYSAVVGWWVFYISIRFSWLTMLFRSIFLLIFCLIVLSVTGKGMLMSPTIIISIFHCSIFSCCFMYFESLLLGVYTFRICTFSWWYWFIYQYVIYLFVSSNILCSEDYFFLILVWLLLPSSYY